MTEDTRYHHLGEEADAEDNQAAGKAPVQIPESTMSFDPAAALAAAGVPQPEEIELAVDELPPAADEPTLVVGHGEVLHPTDNGRDGDWAAFRTWRDDAATEQLTGPTPPEVPSELKVGVEEAPAGINPKDAIGITKPDLTLVPPASNLYQSQAMQDGARKYGPYNWRSNPVKFMIYLAAAQRHIAQLIDGEDFDPISGVHHAGHALACLGIIADARETGNLVDDRPVKGPAGEMIRRFGDTGSYRKD